MAYEQRGERDYGVGGGGGGGYEGGGFVRGRGRRKFPNYCVESRGVCCKTLFMVILVISIACANFKFILPSLQASSCYFPWPVLCPVFLWTLSFLSPSSVKSFFHIKEHDGLFCLLHIFTQKNC
jgi:hypothetical protein